jgi:hypothetical protein
VQQTKRHYTLKESNVHIWERLTEALQKAQYLKGRSDQGRRESMFV